MANLLLRQDLTVDQRLRYSRQQFAALTNDWNRTYISAKSKVEYEVNSESVKLTWPGELVDDSQGGEKEGEEVENQSIGTEAQSEGHRDTQQSQPQGKIDDVTRAQSSKAQPNRRLRKPPVGKQNVAQAKPPARTLDEEISDGELSEGRTSDADIKIANISERPRGHKKKGRQIVFNTERVKLTSNDVFTIIGMNPVKEADKPKCLNSLSHMVVNTYIDIICHYMNSCRAKDELSNTQNVDASEKSKPRGPYKSVSMLKVGEIFVAHHKLKGAMTRIPRVNGRFGDFLTSPDCTGNTLRNLDYLFIPHEMVTFRYIPHGMGGSGAIDMPRLDPVLALVLDQIDPKEDWPIYSGRYKKQLKAQWEPASVSDNTLRGAPQPKSDVHNCGVYTVTYAFCLAFGFDMMCFKQEDLDEGKRGRMFAELCHGGLGEPPFDYDWFDLPQGADNDRELLIQLGYIKETAPAEEKPDEEPESEDEEESEPPEPPEPPEPAPRDDDSSDFDYESGLDDDEDDTGGWSPPRRSGRGANRRRPATGKRRSSRNRSTRTRNADQGEIIEPHEAGTPTTPQSSQPGLLTPGKSPENPRKPEKQRRRRPFEKITDEQLESLDPLTRGRVIDMQLRTCNPALTPKQVEAGLQVGWPMQFPPAMFKRRGFIYKPSKITKDFYMGLSEERLVELCTKEGDLHFEGWEAWRDRGLELFRKWMMNQHEAMLRLKKNKNSSRALKPMKGLLPDSLLEKAGWPVDKDSDDDRGNEGGGKGKEGGGSADIPASGQPEGSGGLSWPQAGPKRQRTPDEDDHGAAPKRRKR